MENYLNHRLQNEQIRTAIKESIKSIFPIVEGGKKLELVDIAIDDTLDDYDFPAQKEVKLNRRSWVNPMYSSLGFKDEATG